MVLDGREGRRCLEEIWKKSAKFFFFGSVQVVGVRFYAGSVIKFRQISLFLGQSRDLPVHTDTAHGKFYTAGEGEKTPRDQNKSPLDRREE